MSEMSAVKEILGLISQFERDKGVKPTKLELHPEYFDQVASEMERTCVYPSDKPGTWLNGVELIRSERVGKIHE